jgi:OPA family sugar phosphate sensor protein UhpC-like MFS transporter
LSDLFKQATLDLSDQARDTEAGTPAVQPALWSRWRFRVFIACWILYASYYFCRKNFSVVMPMMARSDNYKTFDLANLVFIFSLAYAAGQFLAGWLADRFGPRLVATCGGLLSAVCTAAMAIPGPHSALLLLQIGNGLGQGCGWSSCLKILGAWFARKERGTVTAWWGTCYILGGFLATVFATFVATQAFLAPGLGWRRGFLFPAIVLGGGSLFFAWKARSQPRDAGLPSIEDADNVQGGDVPW